MAATGSHRAHASAVRGFRPLLWYFSVSGEYRKLLSTSEEENKVREHVPVFLPYPPAPNPTRVAVA